MVFNILIVHHSAIQSTAEQVVAYLNSKNGQNSFTVHSITESFPIGLSQRADYVVKSQAVIVLLNRELQRNSETMDIIHFAKDLKKRLFGLNTSSSYVPFGALGAIICGTKQGVIEMFSQQAIPSSIDMVLDSLAANINDFEANQKNQPIIDPSRIASPYVELIHDKQATSHIDVLLLFHSDAKEVANMIADSMKQHSIEYQLEEPKTSETTRVEKANVVVMVMSQGFYETYKCRATIESARQLGKKIIPVSPSRAFKPTGWIGLLIAGKLFFRIMDKKQAYSSQHEFYNSPMDSLISEIKVSLSSTRPNYEEVEQMLVTSLNLQIQECQAKLGYWPPETYSNQQETSRVFKREPVLVQLKEPKSDLKLQSVNYMLSQGTKLPQTLFDSFGVPIRDKFDCMISYQWDYQELVRKIFMNFSVRTLNCWFDIWGGMEGNVNESMATAVECSRCMLVFLTQKYLNSENCTLELKYAVYCGKAFVFVLPEATTLDYLANSTNPEHNLAKELIKKHPVYEIKDENDLFHTMINNLPKFDVISYAVREIGKAQPEFDIYSLSDKVVNLKLMLACAKNEMEQKLGVKRFKKCTRCGNEYEENSNKMNDCKKHRAYYVGGTLIAGRWVCCNQTDKNSLGCENTMHIDQPRSYVINEDYGTGTFEPA